VETPIQVPSQMVRIPLIGQAYLKPTETETKQNSHSQRTVQAQSAAPKESEAK